VRDEAGTWLGGDHPGFATADHLRTEQGEVVGVGDLALKLTAFFAIFGFLFFALLAVFFGFVPAFINDLLNLLFFFGGFFF